jgi:tricorn protease
MRTFQAQVVAFAAFISGYGLFAAEQSERGYFRYPAVHEETIVFTAEGDLWRGSIQGGVAQRLTTHPATESYAAISPDGKLVAFTAEYEGPAEVYTMPIEGGVPTRVTFEGTRAVVTGWTQDGKVLFSTQRHSTLPNAQLVAVDLKTGARTVLPLAQASDGAFAPDGKTFFFTRLPFQGSSTKRYRGGTAQSLWRFAEGDEEARAMVSEYPGTSRNPMWWGDRVYFLCDESGVMNVWSMSPDGSDRKQLTRHTEWDIKNASLSNGQIVYSQGADLRVYYIASGQDRALRFTLSSDFDQQRDRWIKKPIEYLTSAHLSENGDRVALTARGQVFVAPVKSGRFVEVTRNPAVRYRNARFFGKTNLVALSDASGELEFAKLPANGIGGVEALTTNGTVFRYDGLPSPNQKWIAHADKDYKLWIWDVQERREILVGTSNESPYGDMDWSPDGEWLAYVHPADNTFNTIQLFRPRDGARASVTSERVDSYSPAWSPDGKWLYFLSDRELRSLVSSPWGQRQPEPFYDQITKIYAVALKKGQRFPFEPSDELYDAEKKEDKKTEKKEEEEEKSEESKSRKEETNDSDKNSKDEGKEKAEEESRNEKKDKKDSKKADVVVEIDLDGLAGRLHEVPVSAGNYQNLIITEKHLLWSKYDTSYERKRHLQQLEIKNESPKAKTIIEDVRGYELSVDRKKLMVQKGESIYVLDSTADKLDEEKKVSLSGWTFVVNPRDEWRQMFTESWRLMRDYFYDRNMHGVDWKATLKKYLPLVERVTDRGELSDLMADMVGELSALHIFVRGGDFREKTDEIHVAALGAELKRDEEAVGWRITHIYKTDPEYPEKLSPLLRPGVDLEAGDVILGMDGVSLFSVPQPEMLLRNKAGRQVLMEVKSKASGDKRQVIVRPLRQEQDADLRYTEWEYTRRIAVEQLSNNQIGYLHLRAMGSGNIGEWAREFYPVFQRQGLIIDVRHNRGGNIDSWILEKLMRKAWFYWQGRAGKPFWNMQYAFRGHVVVLCNEFTASDGEAFSEGFRRLGLGKVIGTRTWGGEIWLSMSNVLVDRGIASAAEIGVYGPEGEWLIEGHGVEPDMVVDNPPHATFKGKDAQLEAAVKYLQELIEKDPRPVPPVPAYPDKAFKFAREQKEGTEPKKESSSASGGQ